MIEEPRLEARIAALESALRMLHHEVKTRSLTVVDADGVARVVISAVDGTGSVLVRLDRPPGTTTGVELYATEPPGEEPALGVCELRNGNVVAHLHVDPS